MFAAKLREHAFSPHTRGCSRSSRVVTRVVRVFPAYAGMFHSVCPGGHVYYLFSPHTRGCSAGRAGRVFPPWVFPAYAGMFRGAVGRYGRRRGFPRIRGDVPATGSGLVLVGAFSPHTRGCSVWGMAHHLGFTVFPAYAGMFLTAPASTSKKPRFPRIRGDVPAL